MTEIFKMMNRSLYRILISVCLVTFGIAFFFQIKQLIERSHIIEEVEAEASSNEQTFTDQKVFEDKSPELKDIPDSVVEQSSQAKAQVVTFAPDNPKPVKTGFLEGTRDYYDLIIVGAGLSGSVFAEQASKRGFLTSLVIDKRDHIGGNCYDFINEKGIRVSFVLNDTK